MIGMKAHQAFLHLTQSHQSTPGFVGAIDATSQIRSSGVQEFRSRNAFFDAVRLQGYEVDD